MTPSTILILALKLVDYTSASGMPVLSAEQSRELLGRVNGIYASCNLQFRLEQYVPADPSRYLLSFHPSSMSELDPIRKTFADPRRLLVVDTGSWDHRRGLGAEGANAWTMLPGEPTQGAIMEGPVAANANLLAHELGHYLNLRHVEDQKNLMNPVVYGHSRALDSEQCADLRHAALGPRAQALRPG